MLNCASRFRASWARRLVRRLERCWVLIEMTFCSFWYSPAMKYVMASEPPEALAPAMPRLPSLNTPAAAIGLLPIVESMATHALVRPFVRLNRLQFVTSVPAAVLPYERRL